MTYIPSISIPNIRIFFFLMLSETNVKQVIGHKNNIVITSKFNHYIVLILISYNSYNLSPITINI